MRVAGAGEAHPGRGRFDHDVHGPLLTARPFKFWELSFRGFSLEPPPGPAEKLIGPHLARHLA